MLECLPRTIREEVAEDEELPLPPLPPPLLTGVPVVSKPTGIEAMRTELARLKKRERERKGSKLTGSDLHQLLATAQTEITEDAGRGHPHTDYLQDRIPMMSNLFITPPLRAPLTSPGSMDASKEQEDYEESMGSMVKRLLRMQCEEEETEHEKQARADRALEEQVTTYIQLQKLVYRKMSKADRKRSIERLQFENDFYDFMEGRRKEEEG